MFSNVSKYIDCLIAVGTQQASEIKKTILKVPVHTGAELLAKKFDMSVINYTTKKGTGPANNLIMTKSKRSKPSEPALLPPADIFEHS